MKYFLLTILLLLLSGCSNPPFGAGTNLLQISDTAGVISITDKIATEKQVELSIDGKYSYVSPTIDKATGIEYYVDEYVTGEGTKGYQITMTKPDGSIKSFGVGDEAIYRSYDWTTQLATSTDIIK